MKSLLVSLLAVGLCTAALPTHAAPKAKPAPTLRVSKAKADGICRDVFRAKRFKKSQRKAAKRKALTRNQSNAVATEVCRFFAADTKSQDRYWRQSLKSLVEQGKLTKADQTVLGKALINPEVIATWKPTTEFGRQLIDYQDGNYHQNDDVSVHANSGAGWVIGGIIGGIAGGVMTGGQPAGIGAGIAVGGAAGSLAETVFSGDEGDGGSTEDGSEGDGEGDGDGGGDGDAGGGE